MTFLQNVSLARETHSDAQTFFICGGYKIRLSEPEFQALGLSNDKVKIVPTGTLADYPESPFGPPSPVKPSDVFFDPVPYRDNWLIRKRWYLNCKHPDSIVCHNVLLAGWVKSLGINFPNNGLPLGGAEDYQYKLEIDADFVDRMYGPDGLSRRLDNLRLPGNPAAKTTTKISLADRDAHTDASRGITVNSFILPRRDDHSNLGIMQCETNVWHENEDWVYDGEWWWKTWAARGRAPLGWVKKDFSARRNGQIFVDIDAWFAYDPQQFNGSNLQIEDYILMRGTLWQDEEHSKGMAWNTYPAPGHGGWLEIHPVDFIIKLIPPLPDQRKKVIRLSCIQSLVPNSQLHEVQMRASAWPENSPQYPGFEDWVGESKVRQVLRVKEVLPLVDGRFTDLSTVTRHQIDNHHDHVEITAEVTSQPWVKPGLFKASYVITWDVPGVAVCSTSVYPNQNLVREQRVDLFTRGSDDAIHYRYYDGTNPAATASYSAWQSFGGQWTSDPAVVSLGTGLMQVFARGRDKALWTIALNAGQASPWSSLGGILTSRPAVCSSQPGRIDVFARGQDNAVWYRFKDPNGLWTNWISLGGTITSAPSATAAGGVCWVFARGLDEGIYFKTVRGPADHSGWQKLELAQQSLHHVWNSAPAVCSPDPANQRIDVFTRGYDNCLWVNGIVAGQPGNWTRIGHTLTSEPAAIAISHNGEGTSCAFWRSTNAKILRLDFFQGGAWDWGDYFGHTP